MTRPRAKSKKRPVPSVKAFMAQWPSGWAGPTRHADYRAMRRDLLALLREARLKACPYAGCACHRAHLYGEIREELKR